ncbi:hypothetical protein GGX14DRAFT_359023 [Mycena pura]|uniref:Uncharacterized protein n=1 Tax=Mycena pura TaxID=153505 RepID=A0AAD6YF64_9AGAR|nr:hypothetical protein GGX14DRAFT_359023 [Mycena pura]
MDMTLFTIDAQSVFKVDDFSQKAIAISVVANGLGILSDAWFLVQFRHLERKDFMNRARDADGAYLYFSLSAKLPSFAIFVSLLSLMAFCGRMVFNTLPTPAIVLGLASFGIVISLRLIVCGARMLCRVVSCVPPVVVRWISDGVGVLKRRASLRESGSALV